MRAAFKYRLNRLNSRPPPEIVNNLCIALYIEKLK